jgi:hypothetical protein
MSDVKHLDDVAVDREQDSVDVRLSSVQELTDLHRPSRFSGATGQRAGKFESEAIASRRAKNQRSPASSACCERSQS